MKASMISFLIGLFIFTIGSVMFFFEITSYKIEDFPAEKYTDKKSQIYEYEVTKNLYQFYCDNCHFVSVIDPEEKAIKVTVQYDNEYLSYHYYTSENQKMTFDFDFKEYRSNQIIRKGLSLLKQMIKEKTIYDYRELTYPTIEVRTNQENAKYIKTYHHE